MRARLDASTPVSSGARPAGGAGHDAPSRVGTVLALQRAAGNQAVVAVLQRGLNPLNAADKPGRLPDGEAVSVVKLLEANGFTRADRDRARSDPGHRADLEARHVQLLAVEARFGGSNINPTKRRALRAELANVYDRLLDTARQNRDAATAAHDAAVEARADLIRQGNLGINKLFKGGGGPWNTSARDAINAEVVGERLLRFTTVVAFQDAVFKRYNAKFAPGAAAAPGATLSPTELAALAAEQQAVQAQLGIWRTRTYNAQGCNENGTWGTTATGSVNFQISHVNARVWAELVRWWRAKNNTYVTPSDTSTWSLKKFRQTDTLSPTFNYHVNVP